MGFLNDSCSAMTCQERLQLALTSADALLGPFNEGSATKPETGKRGKGLDMMGF